MNETTPSTETASYTPDPDVPLQTLVRHMRFAFRVKELRDELEYKLEDRSFEGIQETPELAKAAAAMGQANRKALRATIHAARAYFNSVTAENKTA